MANGGDTKFTLDTKVLKAIADKHLGQNLERQANDLGKQGFVLRSSFLLDEYVICVYQRCN